MNQAHPADNDMLQVGNVVKDLLDSFQHPATQKMMPGLLEQAWGSPDLPASRSIMLHSRDVENESGSHQKPGSRPPSVKLLALMGDVQSTLDVAHQLANDELGFFVNSGERETALRRIPALLEPTIDVDCLECRRCHYGIKELCVCRHRTVTRKLNKCWTALGADGNPRASSSHVLPV